MKKLNIRREILIFFTLTCIILTGCADISSKEETVSLPSNSVTLRSKESNDIFKFDATLSDSERFDLLAEEVLQDSYEENTLVLHFRFKNPERYGIQETAKSLGPVTWNQPQDAEELKESRETLLSFHYDQLTKEQQGLYDILWFLLEAQEDVLGLDLYNEYLSPLSGTHASLPQILGEYAFYDVQDIQDYFLLLQDIPRYFFDIMEFERAKATEGLFMSDASVQETLNGCQSFLDSGENNALLLSFSQRLEEFTPLLSAEEKGMYIEKNRNLVENTVLPAYRELMEQLNALKGSGKNENGLFYFPDGRKWYEYLAKIGVGSEMTVLEMAGSLDEELTTVWNGQIELLRNNKNLAQSYQNMSVNQEKPERIIQQLEQWARPYYPELPNLRYEIKYVPSALEEYTNPAYYLLPQVDEAESHTIYINRSKRSASSDLTYTLAHEGYPGHMYQNSWLVSSDLPLLRKLLSFTGYSEGWADYVENASYQLAAGGQADADLIQLLQYRDIFQTSLYARADIGVNYEGWTKEELSLFLSQFNLTDETLVNQIFSYMIEIPSSYLPYAVGRMEVERLKTEFQMELGQNFNLKSFHEAFLDAGPGPFFIVEKEMRHILQMDLSMDLAG